MSVDVNLTILTVLERSLSRSDTFACPYLPERKARSEGFSIDLMEGDLYRGLMDRNFRRSGQVVYRPACPTCRACRQIRVPTAAFRRTRSLRRVWRRNADMAVSIGPAVPSEEKWKLFSAYLDARHDGSMSRSPEGFVDFLYHSCVDTLEVCYRLDGKLIGVSIIDVVPAAWSSVYMYFDPALGRRSLGTYSVLWEIEHCRGIGLAYYYLGYYVAGSPTMAYKGRFVPHQLLTDDGVWRNVAGR